MKKELDTIEKEDFVVRVRPSLTDEGIWSGEIDVAIITQPENDLQDDDYFQMMHFCKMLASTIPVMEVNEDLRELVHRYVVEIVDKHEEEMLENTLQVVDEKDNVVRLDFASKTKGSA